MGVISAKSCNFASVRRLFFYIFAIWVVISGYGQTLGTRLVRQVARQAGIRLPIEPIVQSVRSQGDPFNRACPYYIYDDGVVSQERSLVGCVATSAEQVVSHYRYPDQLLDSIAGFTSRNNGTIAAIPAGTELDFDDILDVYDDGLYTKAQAAAVARLSYYLGVACRMNWAVGSSGAQVERLVEPLRRAFGYRYVRYLCSYNYTLQRWIHLLLSELSAGRPVIYAGYNTSGSGHAFVIDGVSENGKFHVTWGFGGHNDGWFDLSVLNNNENPLEPTPEGIAEGYCHMQEAIFLHPDSVPYVTGDTLAGQHRLAVDNVTFNRAPDTNMYTVATVRARNQSADDIFSPIELFTYSQLDSLRNPVDIDYLGVVDAMLQAGADTLLQAYVRFSTVGHRMLGVATADSIYLPFDSLVVCRASQPKLTYALTDSTVTPNAASFALTIENTSALYWSGRMVTYSLFEGPYTEEETDLRHYTVLNLPPQGKAAATVTFAHLEPDTDYTLVVRNPWQPALQVEFHTPIFTGIQGVSPPEPSNSRTFEHSNFKYRINHRITIEYDESTGRYRQILSPQR